MWYVVKCPRFECSRYMVVKGGTKRKKCPYCNRSFKVDDNFIASFEEQSDARNYVKRANQTLEF